MKDLPMFPRFTLLSLSLLLASCSMIPAYQSPVTATPEKWFNSSSTSTATVGQQWWRQFNSPELNTLVRQALAQNTDLTAAVQRIAQARAQVRIVSAALLPSIDATASAGRTFTQTSGNTLQRTSTGVGTSIGYEVDLFGGNRANRQSALSTAQAAVFARQALENVTVADVVSTYAAILNTRTRIALAEQSLANARRVLEVIELRFQTGSLSGIEVAQQRTALANAESSLAGLRQQEDAYRTALAVLVGTAPQTFNVAAASFAAMATLNDIPVSTPSRLLLARPDIRQSEAELQAANADIGAARAALFPSLNLSAGLALASTADTLDLTAGLLAPIFNGGALRAGITQATARERELAANYRGTVLNAFREVEDALSGRKTARAQVASLTTASTEATRAYDLTRLRLDAGAIDLNTLLNTQASQLQTQDALLQAQLNALTQDVTLIRALGGGWSPAR